MSEVEKGIERVLDNDNKVLAIVIRDDYDCNGINFLTADDYSQQMAYMHHDKGYVILPHVHNTVKREILYTKEALFIKKGKLRCDFYSDNKEYLKSIILFGGDVILLVSGGHGFKFIEETSMIEIKQGPYTGEADKTRFEEYKGEIKWDEKNE